MGRYLCIATTFLAGQYHGQHDWPPAPARLFQALLAGARTGRYRDFWSEAEPTLRSLEKLPPPEMLAQSSSKLPEYRIAVPNNDSDRAGWEWSAKREFDPASIRTLKKVAPRKLWSDAGPHVYYLWRLAENEIALEPVLRLASFLHTFGWGIDMAYADSFILDEETKQALISESGCAHYIPGEKGALHKVPVPGYLDGLTAAYDRYCNRLSLRGVDPSTRARNYGQQRYQQVGKLVCPTARFLLRNLNDNNKWFAVPWALGMKVAAWMRHAAATALREEGFSDEFVNGYVLGHGNGHNSHMAFVPVPTIRTMHADGSIRRVMMVEPSSEAGSVTSLLQTKLAPSDLLTLVNGGPAKPVCSLAEPPQNDPVFPYYLPDHKESLWHSVTPVVLHGHNSERGKFSLKKTGQLLSQAFENSGHSRQSIADLCFQPAPFWPGTEGALAIRVPAHLSKWPRYHVSVRFREPVTGPVIVGIGKHYGLGLFAAPPSQD